MADNDNNTINTGINTGITTIESGDTIPPKDKILKNKEDGTITAKITDNCDSVTENKNFKEGDYYYDILYGELDDSDIPKDTPKDIPKEVIKQYTLVVK